MTLIRPSLVDLRRQSLAEFAARLPGADPALRNTNLRALADVIAGARHEDLGWLSSLATEVIVDTASREYLERWSSAWGVVRKAATQGLGVARMAGVAGAAIPLATRLVRGDGVEVETVVAATVGGGGTVDVMVRAVLAGAAGATDVGAALRFVSTPAGLADQASVIEALAGAADAESDRDLLSRYLLRLRSGAWAGKRDDWTRSALDVAGVTRCWTYEATPSPGSVTVYPLFDVVRASGAGLPVGDDAYYRPGYPIVGTGDQRVVLDSLMVNRPAGASIWVKALVSTPVALTIANFATDTAAARAAVAAELRDMLYRRAAPGVSISRSWVAEAVSRALGEDRHTLTLPAGDVSVASNAIAVPGAVAFA